MKVLNKIMAISIVMICSPGLVACNDAAIPVDSSSDDVSTNESATNESATNESATNSEEKIVIEVSDSILTNDPGEKPSNSEAPSISEEESESISEAHVHEFGEWTIVKEASVASEGLKERVCACGEKETEVIPQLAYERIDEDGTKNPNGNYILFGHYPQGYKDNHATMLSDTPDEAGYYLASDGEYYVKSPERLYGYPIPEGYEQQYYFKVEPIKWRIMDIEDGTAFLFSEYILDAIPFQSAQEMADNYYYYNTSPNVPEGKYANNYEYSEIRAWLNGDFYNYSFSSAQKDIIKTTIVNNSLSSVENPELTFAVCDNTSDNVFLLSYQELLTPKYGFDDNNYNIDKNRKKVGTRYAKAHTLKVYDNGCSFWYSRSPSYGSSFHLAVVVSNGSVSNYGSDKYHGIVPALKITL